MKRGMAARWLLLIGIAIFTFVVQADVAPLYNYRSMSHIEWVVPTRVLDIVFLCVALGFSFTMYISMRKKCPRMVVLLGFFMSSLLLPVMFALGWGMCCLGALGIGLVIWIVAPIWLACQKQIFWSVLLFCFVPLLLFGFGSLFAKCLPGGWQGPLTITVEARPGESYEEYLRRFRREYQHYCPNCDKPLSHYYNLGHHWYCDSCGYGKDPRTSDGEDRPLKAFTDAPPEKFMDEK